MKNRSSLKIVSILVLSAVACLEGCNPRRWPGFQGEAKRQEERITRDTEEAIKKSAALQELDRLCTQEIARPEGFVPVNKYRDLHGDRFLGYGYQSALDYGSVSTFYQNFLSQHGWQLTKRKDNGWGQRQIEFRKGRYEVILYDLGGSEGINYSLHCEKLSIDLQEVPPSF